MKQEKDKTRTLEDNIEKIGSEKETTKCEHCDFNTTSGKGLKTHMKRKHSESSKGKVPITCEVCDAEVRDNWNLKIT